MKFIDEARIEVIAGQGGAGSASMRREKFIEFGGPDGGDGGKGGSVWATADRNINTLIDYRYAKTHTAKNGEPGRGADCYGRAGDDIELRMPVGTIISDYETGEPIADLTTHGERLCLAQGGVGGWGNIHFKSSTNRAPRQKTNGKPGESRKLKLELKVLADVGLLGMPNAGKSTLISAISNARPKIADYPFTTLHPNLGVVQAGEVRYTIADVPGLIEGASEGKGLGLEFLRHVERCTALLHVIDCATLDPGRDPLSDLDVILAELAAYPVPSDQVTLLERPQLIALNKVDVPDAKDLADMVRPYLEERGYRVFEISAVSHEGLRQLSFALAELVEQGRKEALANEVVPVIMLRPRAVDDQGYIIRVEGGSGGNIYRVIGAKPERWVEQTDFNNEEAVGYLADRLAKAGVEDMLFKKGAVAGSTVIIGEGNGLVFDWEPTMTSAAELMTGPRGTDDRLNQNNRRTNKERRDEYYDLMDAKQEAREELVRERDAGLWQVDDEIADES